MRFPLHALPPGSERTVTRFLWLPKTLYLTMGARGAIEQRRWLEFATWKQYFKHDATWADHAYWIDPEPSEFPK